MFSGNLFQSVQPTQPTQSTQPTQPTQPKLNLLDSLEVKMNLQESIAKNDLNDINMFIKYRSLLFNGSIISSVCATLGLSALTTINIAQSIYPNYAMSKKIRFVPIGIFIVAGGLNLLFNQIDTKLETQQKNLLKKYNINTEQYIDQNTINDIPSMTKLEDNMIESS